MRKLFVLCSVWLVFAACAEKKAPPISPVPSPSPDILATFDQTAGVNEEILQKTAALALRVGLVLDSARAEKCWRLEESRPAVRELCLLLWAGGKEASTTLEAAASIVSSRATVIAALMREEPMRAWSVDGLIAVLAFLQTDPVWLRATVTSVWIKIHGAPDLLYSDQLLAQLQVTEQDGPRDLAATLKAQREIRKGVWQETLRSYCDPTVSGEARLRCWRVIGSIAHSPELFAETRAFLPPAGDEDWILFQRTFAFFASKIQSAL